MVFVNTIIGFFSTILFIILLYGSKNSAKRTLDFKIFEDMLYVFIICSISDSMCYILDGKQFYGAKLLLHIFNFIDNGIPDVMAFSWCIYVDYKLSEKKNILSKSILFYMAPLSLSFIFSVINLFHPILYTLENNTYSREGFPLSAFCYISSLSYMLMSEGYVIANRKRLSKQVFYAMLLFIFTPLAVLIIQFFNNTLSLISPASALSILIIYISIQSDANVLATQEALSANCAKSKFLSHMSHDIRTPLNSIVGMTQIAKENINDTKRVEDCLEKISKATKHLTALVNDVLDITKIESGTQVINMMTINIEKTQEECTTLMKGLLVNRDLRFIVENQPIEYPYVIADPLRLRQILINIFTNAIKFTPDGGRISISETNSLNDANNMLNIKYAISDTGKGMSQEFLKKIYEPFAQEENNARTQYSGSGLGMAIVKSLVETMGGTIKVKSEPDKGTTVTLCFNFALDKTSTIEEEKGSGNADNSILNNKRVLIAEDILLNQEIIKYMLEKYDMKIDFADNGKIAFEKFNASPDGYYDFILMDIMMPVMNGYDATKLIRKLDRYDAKSIPIIAVTANAFYDDIQKSREKGMDAHISKPIDIDILTHELKKLVS